MSTNLLNGYDMVAAMTQNFLNSQLKSISQNPSSKPPPKGSKPNYSIADSFTIQLNPNATAGTPDAWSSLIVRQMNPPTIAIGYTKTVVLTLHIIAGTVQYLDSNNQQQTASLANTDISYTVALSQMTIGDVNDLAAPQQTIDALNGFRTGDFTIQFLALEFESASMISSCYVNSPNFDKDTDQYDTLVKCLTAYLTNGENPYILGYPIQSVSPSVTNPSLPAFAPTSCEFSTSVNQQTAGLSTLNYCLMTNHDACPTDQPTNNNPLLITDPTSSGVLLISEEVFINGYLKPLVLPAIESSLVMPPCPPSPYPQSPNDGINSSNSGWTTTSTGWKLTLSQSNNADNDDGVLVKVPHQPDYYQLINNQVTCDVSLSNVNGNMTITADVSISFYTKLDVQMQLFNWFDATVTQNFTLTLTFTSGNNGQFVITPEITPLPLPKPSQTSNQGFDVKVGQSLPGLVLGMFGIDLNAAYNSLGNNISDTVSNLTNAFANDIGNDMNVLSNQYVLPAGDVFYYNSLLFNSEGDMQVNIAGAK